jgi:transposase
MSKNNQYHFHSVESKVDSQTVIQAIDGFIDQHKGYTKSCLLILDNASIHRSKAFKAHIDRWLGCGLMLHYLPTYSPELNLIEMLWKKVKYEWLPLNATTSFKTLQKELQTVLEDIGNKYTITFD